MSEEDRAYARRGIALLDLTNLDDGCGVDDIDRLCAAAVTPFGPVAAVCVFPAFVRQAKERLNGSSRRRRPRARGS